MDCSSIRFSRHALERLFARAILPEAIIRIVREGETISSYPEDKPFPSVLLLGFEKGEPVHAVVARDPDTGTCIVITVYRPDPALWSDDFRTRRP
jgi:hypothetical protein